MPRTYHLVKNEDDLLNMIAAVRAAGRFALDTETTGLNVFHKDFKLVSLVIAPTNEEAYYIPLNHAPYDELSQAGFENFPVEQARKALVNLLETQEVIYWNAAYDRLVLKQALDISFDLTYGHDGMIMAHLLDENYAKSLKARAALYLGVQESAPDKSLISKDEIAKRILQPYTYNATNKKGHKVAKTGYLVRSDWTETLALYYQSFAAGAVPYKFVEKFMAQTYTTMKEHEINQVAFKGAWKGDFRFVPVSIARQYASDDVMNTLAVFDYMQEVFDHKPKLETLYLTIELPVNDAMTRATFAGIPVNKEMLEEMKRTLALRADALKAEALKVAEEVLDPSQLAEYDFETFLGSAKQLKTFMFDVLKYPVVETTKTGAPSTGKQAMAKLMELEPGNSKFVQQGKQFLTLRAQYQDLNKLLNTYTDSLLEKISEDGKVHPGYNTVGTVSGRMSSNSPNFQQMPRLSPEEIEKKPWLEGIDIRAAFSAPEDYVIVSADFLLGLHARNSVL